MYDFPFRRESGTENRIPGDFFAYFFGRTTDAAAESHRGRLRLPPRRSAVLKPACTALTGSVGCTNGRGARRNRAAYRDQRPFTDYGEAARGSRRQTVGKKVSAPRHERERKNKRLSAKDTQLNLRLFLWSDARERSQFSARRATNCGPPVGRRPARPLTRKLSFNRAFNCRLIPGASEGKTAGCSPAPGVAPGCPLRG